MPSSPVVTVDLARTRRRRQRLQSYVERTLLREDTFLCPSYEICASSIKHNHVFREGTMSHLGRRFDATVDGRPLRVVVVGQESGWPKAPHLQHLQRRVTMDSRYQQIHDESGLRRRYYAEPGYLPRNPHMRGTTSALRVLFGNGLGTDHEGEFVQPVQGHPFHVFDGFALVNMLLCSAGPQNSSRGHPTSTMLRNCASHFAATLAILEPTLVVLQGGQVAKWAEHVLVPHVSMDEHMYESSVADQRVLVCKFSHPSAHGTLRWGDSLKRPYLSEVVVPTLHDAVGQL